MIIDELLKKITPSDFAYRAYIIKNRFIYRNYLGENFVCNICNTHLKKFIPLEAIANGIFMQDLVIKGVSYSISDYETLNVENFLCPICGSQDKARLYDLFLTQVFSNKKASGQLQTFVHFAPEGGLPQKIKKYDFLRYQTADLLRDDVDEKQDLTNLTYDSNSVNYFICSHILEHIPEDDKAISELYRVLKPGGWGVLTVPILVSLPHTYEDSTVKTEKQRLKHFGQADHVRVYAKKDFINKLKKIGFKVMQLSKKNFKNNAFKRHGISEKSILYIVTKI